MDSPLQKLLLVLSLFFFSGSLLAQNGEIRGTVADAKEALSYTTVVLKKSIGTKVMKAELTDDNGAFKFSNIPYGSYLIEVSYVGMEDYVSEVIKLEEENLALPKIILKTGANDLETIEVKAKRPMIEVQADKTVFNVENVLGAVGTNGFELLRKAPGVIVDNNDNVILEGKTGVAVYVNGKLSPLSGEDLTNFLRSMQSSDIDKIEIITQPSSKYDAAGNAGIINIVLKKDKRLGTNGTASIGYGRGRYQAMDGSITVNNRTKKTNIFGSYSAGLGDRWYFINLDRTQQNIRYDSETETVSNYLNQNGRIGLDVFPHSNHTIGFLVDGGYFNRDSEAATNTPISPVATGEVSSILEAGNESESQNYNINSNVNYLYADTSGHELSFDVDYGIYRMDNTNYQPNKYLAADGTTVLGESNYRMITPTEIDIFTTKIDYSQNALKGKVSFGGKYSLVNTDNIFDFFDVVGETDTKDVDRSNQFVYKENVNAAYVNYTTKIKKWSIQGGVRMENTVSVGDLTSTQMSPEDHVERNYLDWFPSAGLTFSPPGKHSWALNYSRRIQRPNYQSLNPFENQLNELSFRKGNPFLQPQYTNNVKFSHTYKYRFTTSLSYSRIHDFFAQVTDTLDSNKNFMMRRNIGNQDVFNIGMSYPFDVTKWWSLYTNINANYSSYKGYEEKYVDVNAATLSLYAQNSFSLPKSFRFEVSGWFSSPSIWGGTYLTKSLGSLDLALQKKFFDDRLSVRLAASDILFTSFWRADTQFGDLYIDARGGGDSRRVKLNLSYRFGNSNVKNSRKRKTGLEDEGKRTGGDN